MNEVGLINTCQRLKENHIGKIVGNDFIVRNRKTGTNLRCLKRLYENHQFVGLIKVDSIIDATQKAYPIAGYFYKHPLTICYIVI